MCLALMAATRYFNLLSLKTVATLAFSSPELREHTTVCYVKPDEPDLDNTLNMLSCLSLCDRVFVSGITAAPTSGWVPRLLVSLFSPFSRDMVYSLVL